MIYIVKPSIVIDDDTKRIGYDTVTDEAKYKHIVKFQNNSKDINIATSNMHNFVYKSLFSDVSYFEGIGIGLHSVEGDYHVGIYKNDIMLLAKYLYLQKVSNPKWTKELEEYIISLKPYYDYNELYKISEQIKDKNNDIKETVQIKTLTKTYTI